MMLAIKLALRDLRGTAKAFRLVLLCLLLGVGALTIVQLSSRNVLGSIEQNGATLLGGDLLIRQIYTPIAPEAVSWLEQRGAVVAPTTEMRAMLVANTQNSNSSLAEVKAIAAPYPLYGQLELAPAIDLGSDQIALDESLRDRLEVQLGDQITVGDATLTFAALIKNEPDRTANLRFSMAPRAMISAETLPKTGLMKPGSMVYHELRIKLQDGSDAKQLRAQLEQQFPAQNWRVLDKSNANPQLTRFIERLSLFLGLTGLTALLIGGIGISTGLRAYLDSRLHTIAILKAQGAQNRTISAMYLLQFLLISVVGSGLGVGLGASITALALPHFSDLLPVAISFHVPVAALLYPFIFGLITTFTFAAWPLGQALATSPLDLFRASISPSRPRPTRTWRSVTMAGGLALFGLALFSSTEYELTLWFVLGAIGSFAGFWFMGNMLAKLAATLPTPPQAALRMAQRNIGRIGNATTNTMIALGLGMTVFVAMSQIELNLRDGIIKNLPDDAPAFFFLDIQQDQKAPLEQLLQAQQGAGRLDFSPNLRGRIVSVKGIPAEQALVDERERWLLQNDRGFTYLREMPRHSEIIAGEWWPANYQGPPLVSVVDDVMRAFDVKVGDKMVVNILGRDIEATIANIREVEWTNFTINFNTTFSPGILEAAPHSWLATLVADPQSEKDIQRVVSQNFPNVTAIGLREALDMFGSIMGGIADAVRAAASIAVVTGMLVLAGSLMASRSQRTYDIVVLKVLGAPRRLLQLAYLLEFALLGLCAGGVALGLGTIISWAVLQGMMDLPWQFFPLPALQTLLASLAITLGLGWLITGNILRSSAAQHLRND